MGPTSQHSDSSTNVRDRHLDSVALMSPLSEVSLPTSPSSSSDPKILPWVQVDKGAIKFLLSGANVMCPGLTSPGARMDVSLPQDTVVVSYPHSH